MSEWLVWSNEHGAFWRQNSRGYTQDINQAGRYSKGEAEEICENAGLRSGSKLPPDTKPEFMIPAPVEDEDDDRG